jgi:probable F420-dependent oxidoreductase
MNTAGDTMKLSIAAPQAGPMATPETVADVARLAEELGLHGLWVHDRVLFPVVPRERYPASPDGRLPAQSRRVMDPLAVLTFAAAVTTRLRLGTAVLVTPWYTPVLLARSLATLDVLSDGRLDVGLGVGWSSDENEATGARTDRLGCRTDEFVAVLRTVWTDDVVAYDGEFVQIPASEIALKPRQRPHPPLLFGAYSPNARRRIARVGDGWLPAGLPLETMSAIWSDIRRMTEDEGRDPAAQRLVVRANIRSLEPAAGRDRSLFAGDLSQISDDVRRCRDIGAHEVVVDAHLTEEAERYPDGYAGVVAALADRCRDVLDRSAPPDVAA